MSFLSKENIKNIKLQFFKILYYCTFLNIIIVKCNFKQFIYIFTLIGLSSLALLIQ